MSAAPVLHEPKAPDLFLHTLAKRCPALRPVFARLENEKLRPQIEDVLRDALRHLPYFPSIEAADATAIVSHDEPRAALTLSELAWLSKEMSSLRSQFESAVFRAMSGASSRQARDTARYYLALVARLFRLEYGGQAAT